MSGGINKLHDVTVRAWIKDPNRSPKKLFDGDGLFLTMTPAGTAVWRLRYRHGGRDRIFSVGEHQHVSLKEARAKRDEARAVIRQGRDPVTARRVERAETAVSAGTTFAECAELWLAKRKPGWSESHYSTVSETLGRHVLKYIGALPIDEITQALVAGVVERLNDRIDTAQKVRQICAGVFRLAQAQGKFTGDNPADAAREVITRRKLRGRMPAFITWPELGGVLRAARQAHLSPAVAMAHRLCAFTASRLGNIVAAEWPEFDLAAGLWTIPRAKMKAQDRHFDHLVFLGPSILRELREWHRLVEAPTTGYLFPSVAGPGRHITHESVEKAYRVTLELKGKHVPHGWRSAWSTLAREEGGFERDAVELALDHVVDSDVVRRYNRGERRPDRIKLAAWWCEQLSRAEG